MQDENLDNNSTQQQQQQQQQQIPTERDTAAADWFVRQDTIWLSS